MHYTASDLLRLTKRWNNPKRSYLLVDPLQGKHIPARPKDSWTLMTSLGDLLAERCPDARLVIGFAETATALAAVAALRLWPDCAYIQTTREELPSVRSWLQFQEEHSHAVEQKLCAGSLAQALRNTPQIVIIDDELSTGRTLRNMVRTLREQFPEAADKPVVAASLISRLSEENERLFAEAGIESLCLLRLPEEDFEAAVAHYHVSPAEDLRSSAAPLPDLIPLAVPWTVPEPRTGVQMGVYAEECATLARRALPAIREHLDGRVLVLGTEECMYPALVLARTIEEEGARVLWHATTRSPIGISSEPGYPVTAGYQVHSFYSGSRATYLYNVQPCELAVLVTDAPQPDGPALRDVARALRRHGCTKLLYLGGGDADVRLL